MALVIVPNKSIATLRDRVDIFDPSGMTVSSLKNDYRDAEIAVQETILKTEHTLRMSDVRDIFNIKIEELLQRIPMSILKPGYPKLDIRMSMYRPLLKAFKYIKLCGKDMHPTQPIEPSEATDLYVENMDSMVDVARENCLFTVNGMFTLAKPHLEGMRIFGAGSIINQSNDLSTGCLIMPATVKCTPFAPNEDCQFTEDGNLYVTFENPDKTYGVVIGGFLHIFGIDSSCQVMGSTYGLFDFSASFILKQIVPYAKHLGLDINFDIMAAEALEMEGLKRKILSLPTSFIVEIDTKKLYFMKGAVQKWWWEELRHETLGTTGDFYGLVKDRGNRVVDYWGVYSENANILYHTLRLNPEAQQYATSIHYESPTEQFTDKVRVPTDDVYEAMGACWYFTRV